MNTYVIFEGEDAGEHAGKSYLVKAVDIQSAVHKVQVHIHRSLHDSAWFLLDDSGLYVSPDTVVIKD